MQYSVHLLSSISCCAAAAGSAKHIADASHFGALAALLGSEDARIGEVAAQLGCVGAEGETLRERLRDATAVSSRGASNAACHHVCGTAARG